MLLVYRLKENVNRIKAYSTSVKLNKIYPPTDNKTIIILLFLSYYDLCKIYLNSQLLQGLSHSSSMIDIMIEHIASNVFERARRVDMIEYKHCTNSVRKYSLNWSVDHQSISCISVN